MQDIWNYIFFENSNTTNVLLVIVFISVSSSMVGSFTLLRKRALLGDAIAHATLPGVCLGFFISGSKNPLFLFLGAFFSGLIATYSTDIIVRYSKIKSDTAIALSLCFYFGLGIMLLTAIQHTGDANQSGLDSFLFGKIASVMQQDLMYFGITSMVVVVVTIIYFKEFKIIAFDLGYAQSIGLPVKKLESILTMITVATIVIGIQAIGVILMAALLITPATTARFWTDSLTKMIFLSIVFCMAGGFMGAYFSYITPNLPTGPMIVFVLSTFAILSFIVAPNKGILSKYLRVRSNQNIILEENILKAMYHLGEAKGNFQLFCSIAQLSDKRSFKQNSLFKGLKALRSKGYVIANEKGYQFTNQGLIKGKRVTRLHRLWEMYLTQYLQLSPDHVHDDAETIEHIITPEIEQKLTETLGYPTEDPHQMKIPYHS